MSFMSKLKDFFYDEEEVEEEVTEPKKEIKKPVKKVNIYDIENEKKKVEKKEDISERELFKSERTFNFPVDFEDEPDFEPVTKKDAQKESIKRSKTENNNVSRTNRRSNSEVKSTRHYTSVDRSPMYHKKEEKTFHPTPIISPIYGILNKNYEKDDVTEKRSLRPNTTEKVDFDSVRKKAYADLDEELERTFNDVKKGIFYNLDEEKEEEENKNTKDEIKENYEEEPYKKDEVIITYDQVPDETDEDENEDDVEVPTITRTKKEKKKTQKSLNLDIDNDEENDSKILDDTKEQDLFNLIDNMYSDEEEEEEDE